MPKASEKHVHKLKRLIHKSGTRVFFCVLDCSYKVSTSLALGKKTICWRCGEEFFMNEYCLRLAKPHCENCHNSKKEPLSSSVKEEELIYPDGSYVDPTQPSLTERLQKASNPFAKPATTEEEGDI